MKRKYIALFFAIMCVIVGFDLMITDGDIGAGMLGIIVGISIFFIPNKKYEEWEKSSSEKRENKQKRTAVKKIESTKQYEHYTTKKSTTFCPQCKSTNIQFLGNNRKGFSVGKAVGGAVLTGGIGTLAGFAGKKGKKDSWHCAECGNTFEMKRK